MALPSGIWRVFFVDTLATWNIELVGIGTRWGIGACMAPPSRINGLIPAQTGKE